MGLEAEVRFEQKRSDISARKGQRTAAAVVNTTYWWNIETRGRPQYQNEAPFAAQVFDWRAETCFNAVLEGISLE